jgi:hypothetical protein
MVCAEDALDWQKNTEVLLEAVGLEVNTQNAKYDTWLWLATRLQDRIMVTDR